MKHLLVLALALAVGCASPTKEFVNSDVDFVVAVEAPFLAARAGDQSAKDTLLTRMRAIEAECDRLGLPPPKWPADLLAAVGR